MISKTYSFVKAMLSAAALLVVVSCDDDFNAIGADILDEEGFISEVARVDVAARNLKIQSVGTNGLPLYQLGEIQKGDFGLYSASVATQVGLPVYGSFFGDASQTSEDGAESDDEPSTLVENERVTKVYLNIPFQSVALLDTADTDPNTPAPFRVDSIFGNREATFRLQVREFTRFLRDLDPNSNFTERQQYFSNEDPTPFLGEFLFDEEIQINEEQIILFENEDDPDTEENEAEQSSEQLSPRIRVELDTDFFQEKILDREGDDVLSSQAFFREYFRGIHLSADVLTDDLLIFFDFANAGIEIRYEFNNYNNNGTADDTTDDFVDVDEGRLQMNFSGNKVNYLQEEPYSGEIATYFTGETEPSRLVLRGGAGSLAALDLSALDADGGFVDQARAGNWLINDASLTIFADEQASLSENQTDLPNRLFLYDLGNERNLIDYNLEFSGQTGVQETSFLIFDGRLNEESETEKKYRFRITEYLKRIIANDSTNFKLGLSLSSRILNPTLVEATDSEGNTVSVPAEMVPNNNGVVLYGNQVDAGEEPRRIKLEIYYTEPK